LINIPQTITDSRMTRAGLDLGALAAASTPEYRHSARALRKDVEKGFGVPKYDSCAGFGCAMLSHGRLRRMTDRTGIDNPIPPGVALVPVAQPIDVTRSGLVTRPDPSFVAHLIATAAQVPQTRNLRRAAPSDAQSAYTASLRPVLKTGCLTRQVV
jgi:hypothetical protein